MGVRKWDEINLGKSKAIRFTIARVKPPLSYSLGEQKIPEANSCIVENNLTKRFKLGGPSK